MPKKIVLKTKKNAASPAKFIAGITDAVRRADAQRLLGLMRGITKKQPVMWGSSMIGFDEMLYRRSNGAEAMWLKIGFSPRKDALSLYLTCDISEYAQYLKKLGPHRRGVGCLYIKRLADVDEEVLVRLISEAYKSTPKWARS